jgi:SAM-dependent methyltransferase
LPFYRKSADARVGLCAGSGPAETRSRCSSAPELLTNPPIPEYLRNTYRWAYLDDRNARLLDREPVVKAILWGQHSRLRRAAFSEIDPGQNVLQAACVYGDFSIALAEHIGPDGHLQIVDVARVQVQNCQRKISGFGHVTVRHENVLFIRDRALDAVVCYFLLHELPDSYKHQVASVLLDSVRPGGKVIFVDYHSPHWAHPVRPITSLVFDLLEPYAKALWQTEIATIGGNDERFAWRKQTFFGGLFQKVVATRR